jgi:hypothetical protein
MAACARASARSASRPDERPRPTQGCRRVAGRRVRAAQTNRVPCGGGLRRLSDRTAGRRRAGPAGAAVPVDRRRHQRASAGSTRPARGRAGLHRRVQVAGRLGRRLVRSNQAADSREREALGQRAGARARARARTCARGRLPRTRPPARRGDRHGHLRRVRLARNRPGAPRRAPGTARGREGTHATGRRARRPAPGAAWVPVDKHYAFDTDKGERTLPELFGGRSQLLVYHFMFGPRWMEAVRSAHSGRTASTAR